MMYNDERFVSEPDFIFWLFNTYRRSEIVSLVAFVAKRDVGVQVTKDDIVNAVKYLQHRTNTQRSSRRTLATSSGWEH
jgi:hypothetical protein